MDLAKSGIIGSIDLSEGEMRQDFQLICLTCRIEIDNGMAMDMNGDADMDRDTYRDKDKDRDMDTTQHRNGKPLLTIHTAQLAPILPY
jgi:hypothetical protein